jgi:hypothetical protein
MINQACKFFCLFVCSAVVSAESQAAYISEIDLGGPAGQGIELSQVDTQQTLLIIDANASSAFGFGWVLDVIEVPGSIATQGVAMLTDQAWPDTTALTTTLASLNPASGDATFEFNDTRLLVLMQGASSVQRLTNPLTDPTAASQYDTAAVTDWLVLGQGDFGVDYLNNGHDITGINATFGIDLLTRLVDKDAGRVIGRTNEPGEAIDMDRFFVGTPNASYQFDVAGGFRYTYTPSANNPSLAQVPEPSSLAMLIFAAGSFAARRRRPACR